MTIIAFSIPIVERKLKDWAHIILDNLLDKNRKHTDATRDIAGVRERSCPQETPDWHILILTFERIEPVAGFLQVLQNLLPEFVAAVMKLHG